MDVKAVKIAGIMLISISLITLIRIIDLFFFNYVITISFQVALLNSISFICCIAIGYIGLAIIDLKKWSIDWGLGTSILNAIVFILEYIIYDNAIDLFFAILCIASYVILSKSKKCIYWKSEVI